MGVKRIVTCVANEGETWHTYVDRKRQQRYLVGGDIQLIHLDAAICITIDKADRLRVLLLHLKLAFQPFRRKRQDVLRVVVVDGRRKGERRPIEHVGVCVAQQRALLQTSVVSFEGDRLISAAKIDTRHFEGCARAEPEVSIGIAIRADLLAGQMLASVVVDRTGLGLESESIGEGVAPRFLQIDDHVLVRRIAARILHRFIYFIEQAQVIKTTLRVQQRCLV